MRFFAYNLGRMNVYFNVYFSSFTVYLTYFRVQTILRPPKDIRPLAAWDVSMAFMEFALHVLSQQERGDLIPNYESWSHSTTYMRWFCRVSHPIVNPHCDHS
jgi:hypothetical protein